MSLCAGAGVQFPFLKAVAWAGMMLHHSQTAPMRVAFARTFDGKHPCDLCKHLVKMYKSEKKDLKQSSAKSEFPDFFCSLSRRPFTTLECSRHIDSVFCVIFSASEPPLL